MHLKSRLRQDSEQECPICREMFKDEAQVWHDARGISEGLQGCFFREVF